VRLSGANVHDSKMLEPLLDAIPPIHGKRRPVKLRHDQRIAVPQGCKGLIETEAGAVRASKPWSV